MVKILQLARQPFRQLRTLHGDAEHGAIPLGHLLPQPGHVVRLERRVRDARDDGCDGFDVRERQARADGMPRQRAVERVDEPACVLGLARHAQLQGAETADAEPALQTAHHAAEAGAVFEHAGDPRFVLHGEHAAEEIRVAADVLCAAVHDDVGAVFEGVLQWGWSESRVNAEVRTAGVSDGSVVCDVKGFACWIDGCLQTYQVTFVQIFGFTVEGKLRAAS